jgi:hypothetical protein
MQSIPKTASLAAWDGPLATIELSSMIQATRWLLSSSKIPSIADTYDPIT